MGWGRKKRRRTTQTFVKTIIEHKVIKLSYLQTLSIVGGLGDLKEVAGETEGFQEDKDPVELMPTTRIKGNWLGRGKKVGIVSKSSIDDKGWRMVKTWLQPEFDKIRYALGIRELTIAQFRYETVSEVISQPWISPKDIVKVSLIVDSFIPPQFPPGKDYLQFYIKPELPNSDWIRINPIDHRTVYDDKGNIVPRIISFNTERPAQARLEDAYVTTDQEVKQMRFRAVLNRPKFIPGTDVPADGFTPILKSYRMLLHPRGGL